MADVVIHGGDVATLQGPRGARAEAAADIGLRREATIAIEGGVVTWLGDAGDWDGQAATTIEAWGRLVTPGFVDPHCHLVYAGDRTAELGRKLAGESYMDILRGGGGIMETVRATRAASPTRLTVAAQSRAARMRALGTTLLESKSGYGLDTKTELGMLAAGAAAGQQLEIPMVHSFLGAHAVPPGTSADEYVDLLVQQMLPAVAEQGIATFCDAFVETDVFTVEHGEHVFAAAKRHGLQTRLHADEIDNTGGAELAARAGCISADHLLRVSSEGIEALADAGTIATLMPTVPLTLMRPEWPPAKALQAAGVPIALGTDHNPNNAVESMCLVVQLACFTLGLTPEQALTAATWNAACALGKESSAGCIDVGRPADVVVHDVATPNHLVAALGHGSAMHVVQGGRVIH